MNGGADVDVRAVAALAAQARRNVVRMIAAGGSGHLGGAMSCVDIVAALYGGILDIDPADPEAEDRDRFLLSAGHKALAQYAVLAARGFFPEEVLDTYGDRGSRVPGHPDMHKLPGVEASTGALGHGLAIGVGMALAGRLRGSDRRVVVVLGDGELAEGSNWEAFAAAAHHGVDRLTAVIDRNDFQISGPVHEVMNLEPLAEKLVAFGWSVRQIDGHDLRQVIDVLSAPPSPGRPRAILASTVKGRGIAALAGRLDSHYWTPTTDELDAAGAELDAAIVALAAELDAGAVR